MEEAERLNRFVKNVLQITRVESGTLTPRLQWADVEDLISTSLDAAHRRLNNYEVYADITDKLPMVHVDFVLMESVLVNVLDNATKYAPEGSSIQITARRMGEDVTIDITDQGRGIAGEDLGAVLNIGELSIDMSKRLVSRAGSTIKLSRKEYDWLKVLATHPNKVIIHQHLLKEVWGPGYVEETQYLRVCIGQLRQKLEREPAEPAHLITEPGVGYRLRVG
jgi:LytS/YehU family sensor histidine kinase